MPKSFNKNARISGGDLFHFYLLTELGIVTRLGSNYCPEESNKIRLVISQPEKSLKEALKTNGEKFGHI